MIAILAKQNVDCMTGKVNTSTVFKALTSESHSSTIVDHMTQTGHRIKWDHFDILATRQSDIYCKTTETLLIDDLKPALND